jgi:hypothetical protein
LLSSKNLTEKTLAQRALIFEKFSPNKEKINEIAETSEASKTTNSSLNQNQFQRFNEYVETHGEIPSGARVYKGEYNHYLQSYQMVYYRLKAGDLRVLELNEKSRALVKEQRFYAAAKEAFEDELTKFINAKKRFPRNKGNTADYEKILAQKITLYSEFNDYNQEKFLKKLADASTAVTPLVSKPVVKSGNLKKLV